VFLAAAVVIGLFLALAILIGCYVKFHHSLDTFPWSIHK
jgi:hypothetical protein